MIAMADSAGIETQDDITVVTIHRPHARNAVDRETAGALAESCESVFGRSRFSR
jgi:enoyl-CoA hydratase/carnithine racemase